MINDVAETVWMGDSIVRVEDLGPAVSSDFNSDKLIILIHGFTAHGKYLLDLGTYLQNNGFKVLIYNYNSYRGILNIAKTLEDLLYHFNQLSGGVILEKGFFVIAHSLGGLIARQLVSYDWLSVAIKGIVMLGTPNDGTLRNKKVLDYYIKYGRNISEVVPALTTACQTAQELTKNDTRKTFFRVKFGVIDEINDRWKKAAELPPCLTISGGKGSLQIFPNQPRANWVANRTIQRAMKGETNDGLVPESSVDLTNIIRGGVDYKHLNAYPEFAVINHSNLKDNQAIRLRIISWITAHP